MTKEGKRVGGARTRNESRLQQNSDWQGSLVLNLSFKVESFTLEEVALIPGWVVVGSLLKSSTCCLRIQGYEGMVSYRVNSQGNSKAKYEPN